MAYLPLYDSLVNTLMRKFPNKWQEIVDIIEKSIAAHPGKTATVAKAVEDDIIEDLTNAGISGVTQAHITGIAGTVRSHIFVG